MSKRDIRSHIGPIIPAQNRALRNYASISSIDGTHPWRSAVPEGYMLYPVRRLAHGIVAFFNFTLAKEMGLIPQDHPHEMNEQLCKVLLDTFCIQIVNEYDQQKSGRKPMAAQKENLYMATRYLQLQHANKQGRTSGDGRSIWNGTYEHHGMTWDISSRGTGVTALAPGAVAAQKPLKTGNTEMGYGCGQAELDELYGSALMSEIFHRNGVPTERMLAIIETSGNLGIGVRAAPNLLRPAHLFLYLKQARWGALKRATQYFIQRQLANGHWEFSPQRSSSYESMLQNIAQDFARFAAQLERKYIFAWMDWDGDNVLANAGIIDYGSVRQFGLRHDQYRYDDQDRYSTNLNEQRIKARLTVQVFAQLVDYLRTKNKKPLPQFAQHPILKRFDECYAYEIRKIFLCQIGLTQDVSVQLLKCNFKAVEKLYQAFLTLECAKTKRKMKRVADGVNRPAIFNMRTLLRELPSILKNRPEGLRCPPLSNEECLQLMLSRFAKGMDTNLTPKLKASIGTFQNRYLQVLRIALSPHPTREQWNSLTEQAQRQNQAGRITGNSAEYLVAHMLQARHRGISANDVQNALELFVEHQSPRAARKGLFRPPVSLESASGKIFQQLLQVALEHEEDI